MPPASTNAGNPRTVRAAAWRSRRVRGNLVEVVGPRPQAGAFESVGHRRRDGLPDRRGEPLLQCVEVLAAAHSPPSVDSTRT